MLLTSSEEEALFKSLRTELVVVGLLDHEVRVVVVADELLRAVEGRVDVIDLLHARVNVLRRVLAQVALESLSEAGEERAASAEHDVLVKIEPELRVDELQGVGDRLDQIILLLACA